MCPPAVPCITSMNHLCLSTRSFLSSSSMTYVENLLNSPPGRLRGIDGSLITTHILSVSRIIACVLFAVLRYRVEQKYEESFGSPERSWTNPGLSLLIHRSLLQWPIVPEVILDRATGPFASPCSCETCFFLWLTAIDMNDDYCQK